MKICLDAGHYGKYNQSPVNKKYYESEMTWRLHIYLKEELEKRGIEVVVTRKEQSKDLALTKRGNAAKGCDLFLSLHSNACNTESEDFPLACCTVSGKADKIGQILADVTAKTMNTKQGGRIWKRQGNNGDYYGVLRGAAAVGVPGVLMEHSFHTNKRSTDWLLADSNLKKLAAAEAQAIAEFYGAENVIKTEPVVSEGSYLVRVSIDNLNIRTGPGTSYTKTGRYTGKGVFTIVETKGDWGRLKAGGWICLNYAVRV